MNLKSKTDRDFNQAITQAQLITSKLKNDKLKEVVKFITEYSKTVSWSRYDLIGFFNGHLRKGYTIDEALSMISRREY